MRIAVAVHGYPPASRGGVERVASEQAETLAARGHDVFVFTRDPDAGGVDGRITGETAGAVRVRSVIVRDGSRTPFSEYYEGAFLDEAFRAFLQDVRPDVLHVQHLATLSNRLVALAQEAGVPVVLSLHDAYFLCHRLFLLDAHGARCPGPDAGLRCVECLAEHGVGDAVRTRFDAMARLLAGCDAVLAPSPSLARRHEAELPFLRGRIEIVEPGLARVPRPRARTGDPGGPLRLAFIGTLLPHKGLDVLIDALTALPRDDFGLTVFGEEVAGAEAWTRDLRRRTEARPVRWHGPFAPAELDGVLGRTDVLVLPSRCDESWSRVVREARAAGLAVVASGVGGPADWLVDGEDALLVEPGSVGALGQALERLARDRALLERLSRPAEHVPTVADAAVRLEEVFRRVASREGGVGRRPTRVTVAYVTRNGAPWIDESVRAVRAQRGPFELAEILAVDSGSTDGTVEILGDHGVRTLAIASGDFGHGRTRNLLAREAEGDVVVFLTQDASPADERWLAGLVRALEGDPLCAAAWSRHLPRPECHPMEWRMLAEHPPFREGAPPVQSARGNPTYAADPDAQCSLSNNAAAYRRDLLVREPFPEVAFAEDHAWARLVLEQGWRTRLVRDSIVRHSHSYSAWVNLRRNFDHWRTMAGELGHKDAFTLAQGWRAAFREAGRDVAFWTEHTGRSRSSVALRWALPATAYHLGAFTGRWLGSRADRLPAGLTDRLSIHVAARRDGTDR